jgi:transposase-like protein
MTPHQEITQQQDGSQAEIHDLLRQKLQEAVRFTLIEILEAEVEAYVGAGRYERDVGRRDYRNGHLSRTE